MLRFVQAATPPSLLLSWVRFFTAPLRALSPIGLFTAIAASVSATMRDSEFLFQNQELGLGSARLLNV
jgi:hypothetical protein